MELRGLGLAVRLRSLRQNPSFRCPSDPKLTGALCLVSASTPSRQRITPASQSECSSPPGLLSLLARFFDSPVSLRAPVLWPLKSRKHSSDLRIPVATSRLPPPTHHRRSPRCSDAKVLPRSHQRPEQGVQIVPVRGSGRTLAPSNVINAGSPFCGHGRPLGRRSRGTQQHHGSGFCTVIGLSRTSRFTAVPSHFSATTADCQLSLEPQEPHMWKGNQSRARSSL